MPALSAKLLKWHFLTPKYICNLIFLWPSAFICSAMKVQFCDLIQIIKVGLITYPTKYVSVPVQVRIQVDRNG